MKPRIVVKILEISNFGEQGKGNAHRCALGDVGQKIALIFLCLLPLFLKAHYQVLLVIQTIRHFNLSFLYFVTKTYNHNEARKVCFVAFSCVWPIKPP